MSLDILGAVYDFLRRYILTDESVQIIRGWQNSAALPEDSAQYAVLTLLDARRQGTNVHDWQPLSGSDTDLSNGVNMLTLYDVQVDFCGEDAEETNAWAVAFSTLARDAVAVEFFTGYDISCLYADDIRALPFSSDTKQWEARYSVTLHLSAWTAVTVEQEAFTQVSPRIENVDMHHKP